MLVCLAVLTILAASANDAPATATRKTGWLPPTVGLEANGGANAAIAVAGPGVIVAAWTVTGGSGGAGRVSIRGADHRGGPATTVGSRELFNQRLAVTAAGLVVLTGVQLSDDLSTESVVAYERRPQSMLWLGPILLDAQSRALDGPEVAIDDAGRAVAAWTYADTPG